MHVFQVATMYCHKDYLVGSYDTTTDVTGNIVEKLNYDLIGGTSGCLR